MYKEGDEFVDCYEKSGSHIHFRIAKVVKTAGELNKKGKRTQPVISYKLENLHITIETHGEMTYNKLRNFSMSEDQIKEMIRKATIKLKA
jgi:2'-5' RNA ligase